jgi:hypothetical protein
MSSSHDNAQCGDDERGIGDLLWIAIFFIRYRSPRYLSFQMVGQLVRPCTSTALILPLNNAGWACRGWQFSSVQFQF